MQNFSIDIIAIARTPQGNMLGALKDIAATDLGATVIQAVLARAGLAPSAIGEVLMGCVLPAGLGQAPARQAALKGSIPVSTPCTTISKVCGSGMKAVMLAYDCLLLNPDKILVAGGMESMSNAPYLLLKGRQGYRFGKAELIDHMTYDGLEDAYQKGYAMGYFADQCAKQYGFTRAQQDEFAIRSLMRARAAIADGSFSQEIVPVKIESKHGTSLVDTDEHPQSVKLEKIPLLPAAFTKGGTVTAANSSSIADGAAALILMNSIEVKKRGIQPLAKIIGHSSYAKASSEFTTAPIGAIKKLLAQLNWSIDSIDLFEINEAFAVVVLAVMHDLKVSADKINIHGGGCALGHPIGATGARIIVTLVAAMQQKGLKRGIAALCIGGGEATAVAIEMDAT